MARRVPLVRHITRKGVWPAHTVVCPRAPVAFQAMDAASASARRSSRRAGAVVELELAAGEVPAAAQQVVANRGVAERVARHQVGGRAGDAHPGDALQFRVGFAALLAAPQFGEHARQAEQGAGADGGIARLGEHAVDVGGLGRLGLQEFEQFAFGEGIGAGLRFMWRGRGSRAGGRWGRRPRKCRPR